VAMFGGDRAEMIRSVPGGRRLLAKRDDRRYLCDFDLDRLLLACDFK